MRLLRRISLLVVLAGSVIGSAGCAYDPRLEDGTLRCSTSGECPEGYACQTNLCYSKDAAGLPLPLRWYVGTWTMGTSSNVFTTCDDGYTDTTYLSPASKPSPFRLDPDSAKTGLQSSWLCNLHLAVDDSGAYLDDANPACTDTSDDPVYTWTATTFNVYTTNGTTGTHTATYQRYDEYKNGKTVTCEQTVTATLTK